MDYLINNFRSKKFEDRYFVTTDHGSYCILSLDEFKRLKQNNINDSLKEKLEEREIILMDRNIDEAVRLTRNRNAFLFSGTSLHIIVVTLRCNMQCIYCHASSKSAIEKGFDMDKETAKKTVDFIFQSPRKSITIEFQGGEPLLNWDVVKYIIEYAQKKNLKAMKKLLITIVTNLTEMDMEKMSYLIKYEVGICTSLDGPRELHDHNRKFLGGSNYEQVVKWIKRFIEGYNKKGIENRRVNALVTLTRESLKYPKEIIGEYVKLGLTNIHLRFLNNLGVAKQTWPKINYSVKEYLDFWEKAVGYIDKLKKQGNDVNERMITIMVNKIQNEVDPSYLDLRSPCGAAIGQLAYNFNGDIYTCDEARMIEDDLFLLGNVKKDKYKDIVTCDKACATVAASINEQYVCDGCVYKPYCGICPVCNYAEQGNVIGKITQTARCKIYQKQFDWVVREKFINVEMNK
jgi:His-Xaa-Ser system radical SAM maturase HxsB